MPLGAARAGFTLAGGAKDMEMTIYMAKTGIKINMIMMNYMEIMEMIL